VSFTVVYLTNRWDCKFEWFHASLMRQAGGRRDFKLVVVDFHADRREGKERADVWTAPKPTVWQGPHRLTSVDYFAPSNARNTGLCFAEGSHVVFVDDLSVLMDGWLGIVKGESSRVTKRVMLGRYGKVVDLQVGTDLSVPEEYGRVLSYKPWPTGEDSRYDPRYGEGVRKMAGGAMFGASVCVPLKAMLDINGFDEDCDGMGGEDYAAGLMLEGRKWGIVYHQGMRTLEDEMLHHVEAPFKRIIKHHGPESKFTEKDASLCYLNMVRRRGRRRAPNYANMTALRDHVLAGGEFPVSQVPEHDWRDGQPLREM